MEAAAASGCRNATLRAERRAAARAGAHLFDLVILQLGEVIGQELRGDHADGRGRGAAGVGPASVLRSPGEQWSSGGCSAAPPPPPAAAPPPRPGRRRLARSPAPRSRPRQGDSRQPAHLLGAHWLPPASAAPGGGVRARAGGRGGRSLPRRKGGGGAARSPTVRHLPARPPRREPARGLEARSGAQDRAWRRPAGRTRAGRGRRCRPTRAGRAAPEEGRLPAGAACGGAAPFPGKSGLAPGVPRRGRRRRPVQKWACKESWAWAGGSGSREAARSSHPIPAAAGSCGSAGQSAEPQLCPAGSASPLTRLARPNLRRADLCC